MQGAACCRCVQPASVQPRKTYNTLVGQLFDVVPIKTDDPIDSTMRRKIQKLQEYLQNNPAKVPKVSKILPVKWGGWKCGVCQEVSQHQVAGPRQAKDLVVQQP